MAKHLIYLAAGSGRRFGGNKLLYSLEGRPLFSYGLETLRRVAQLRPECEVTVVSRYPQILEAAQTAGVRAVDSPQSVGGISHTIRAALDALPPVSGEDFLFFAVADQPWLEADTLLRLVDAARPGVPGAPLPLGRGWAVPPFSPGRCSQSCTPSPATREGGPSCGSWGRPASRFRRAPSGSWRTWTPRRSGEKPFGAQGDQTMPAQGKGGAERGKRGRPQRGRPLRL